MDKKYFTYKIDCGDIKVVYDSEGVTSVILPYDREQEPVDAEYCEDAQIKKYFDDYFKGLEPNNPKLNISVTAFQRKVFDILQNTKMGTYLTYGDIAKLIGCGSSQAVGQALKRNPVPIIIPCHRVVGRGWDGGFAGETDGPKMEFKKFLLKHEEGHR